MSYKEPFWDVAWELPPESLTIFNCNLRINDLSLTFPTYDHLSNRLTPAGCGQETYNNLLIDNFSDILIEKVNEGQGHENILITFSY